MNRREPAYLVSIVGSPRSVLTLVVPLLQKVGSSRSPAGHPRHGESCGNCCLADIAAEDVVGKSPVELRFGWKIRVKEARNIG